MGSLDSSWNLSKMEPDNVNLVKREYLSKQYIHDDLSSLKKQSNYHAKGSLVKLYYKMKLFSATVMTARQVYMDFVEDPSRFESIDDREGLAMAAFILGRCLLEGRGVEKIDDEGGQMLIDLAVEADKYIVCQLHDQLIAGNI